MRKSIIIPVLVAVPVLLLCCIGSAVLTVGGASVAPTSTPGGAWKLTVSGDGTADVSWYDAAGTMQQDGGAALPWSVEIPDGDFTVVSVTAQRSADDKGSIACTITDPDGNDVKHGESSGPFAVVVCSNAG